MCDESESPPAPPHHVLIFPFPLQGPVNCMLKLAELFCLHHIKVTFLNTRSVHQSLQECSDAHTYFAKYPNFSFETLPDSPSAGHFGKMMESIEAEAVPVFEEMVTCGAYAPDSGNPVTCIIADAIFSFATDIAKRISVPLLCFDTMSPCCVWVYQCLPDLIAAEELPFKDENLDEVIISDIIRRRDLPNYCQATKDLNNPDFQQALKQAENIALSRGLILNTFQELDAPVLSHIRNACPNIYAIGPLHAHLKTRLTTEIGQQIQASTPSTSFWKEDRSCISWLNEQPLKSVIYVSIGSLALMTKDQLFEIWYGLVNSGSGFLWVQRPGSVKGLDFGYDQIPVELNFGTRDRGCIVGWAPQEEVLAHPAIGGFLTHSGWNSTLESIVEGKPMICWPYQADQQVNSRYVGEVWKLGLDMKDTCDRVIVEKMIREVMESRKDEFLNRAEEMAKLAKWSVCEGGSSFTDLDRLIEDIKMMKIPAV
ncbi:hypothetical protein ACS0TY_000938 [Phlomoides rotata]